MDYKRGKQWALDIGCDAAGGILYAVGLYTFASTAQFAPGGISGIALLLNHLWGLPLGITSLVLNIPLVALSFKIVGRSFLFKTMRSMVVCTLFLDVVFPFFPTYTGSSLLAALYSGALVGAGLALFYLRGSSSGGTDFLIMSVKVLRPHLSIGSVTMAIDLVVILLGWPVFGNIDAVLYGMVATATTSVVVDKIMYGMGAGKLAIIITVAGNEVAAEINRVCQRGSTLIRARGSYTDADRQVLLCACSRPEAYKVRSAAHAVDPGAFVMITETSEVFGEGFLQPGTHKL